jgi:hypothetical protein
MMTLTDEQLNDVKTNYLDKMKRPYLWAIDNNIDRADLKPMDLIAQLREKYGTDIIRKSLSEIIRLSQVNRAIPPLHKQVVNFADSVRAVAKAALAGRKLIVPDDVLETRMDICQSNECGHFNAEAHACSECGCRFVRKLPLAEMECGVGKWGKWVK